MSSTGHVAGGRSGLLPNLVAGVLVSLVALGYAISYAALIFSGPELQPYLSAGIQVSLTTAWLVALAVALGSCFEFAIGGPDANATAILALIVAGMAGRMRSSGATSDQVSASVMVMLAVTAVLVGAIVYLIGALRRGRLIRFLPYPVVGGFLAGTGYLIFGGGFKVLVGRPLAWETLTSLPPIPPVGWGVAALTAVCMLVVPRFCKHYLVMPAILVAGVVLFYLGLQVSGIGTEAARAQGLLLQPLERGGMELPALYSPARAGLVQWDAMLAEWQNFAAMVIVVVITILLNATGLDLATRHDVDFDRELRVNGAASALSGLCGGMTGYITVSRSLLNFMAGGRARSSGLCTAAISLIVALLFTPLLSYVPRPVLAGMLLFLGFSMLLDWLWGAFFKLPFMEYAVLVTIVVLFVVHGLISGVVFGLLVASVFFVYSYSHTSCIKHCFACSTHFSNKERSLEQTALLRERGKMARALALQGYLFFGTSSAVVDTCRELVERDNVKLLLLDFRLVQGLDASAVLSFNKLVQVCEAHGVRLLLSGLRPETRRELEQTRFLPNAEVRVFTDMDHGLEWMEDELLAAAGGAAVTPPAGSDREEPSPPESGTAVMAEQGLRRILSAQFGDHALDVLISHCEWLKLEAGTPLFRRGDPSDALYFIEHGEVSVQLQLDDGQTTRLRSFGPGTVVGEMGLHSKQPRSADVVAVGMCRVCRLSADKLARMVREHPEVAIEFYAFVIRLLSARLAAANEEIRALL